MSESESTAQKNSGIRVDSSHGNPARMFDSRVSIRREAPFSVLPSEEEREMPRPAHTVRRPSLPDPRDARITRITAAPTTPPAEAAKPAPPPQPPTVEAEAKPRPAHPPLRIPDPQPSAGTHRKLEMFKTALVIAQKMMPLLDGNVVTTVSNLLAPRGVASASAKELATIESGLKALNDSHRGLSDRVAEQNSTVKSLADRLDLVKEATDRNTLEQQEMMADARALRKKMVVFAWAGMALLVASVAMNLILLLRMMR
jgi:hypothetical protein